MDDKMIRFVSASPFLNYRMWIGAERVMFNNGQFATSNSKVISELRERINSNGKKSLKGIITEVIEKAPERPVIVSKAKVVKDESEDNEIQNLLKK
jgi:hypothetical protein